MKQLKQIFADPRHGQILALSTLISLGIWAYAFEMPWWRPITALSVAIGAQALVARVMGFRFDWRSAAISALSLTLLLRTEGPGLVALAAVLAIASKLIRWDGRHFFNPTAFAIVLTALAFPDAWVSPGQWGTAGWIAVVGAGAGLAVTYGARRFEVPALFLAFWAALTFTRAWYLGDPMAIPLHQMSSGALVVFAFFMISDPMTAPWHPLARATWVGLVAFTGFTLQVNWIVDAGPLFGLVLMAPLVPVLNRLFPSRALTWRLFRNSKQGDTECVPS